MDARHCGDSGLGGIHGLDKVRAWLTGMAYF